MLYYENKKFTKESLDIDKGNINKFLVETILMDDLLNYLPKRRDNKSYEQAILKIDIEGFEYGVLRDLLKTKCKVGQICVEFHHGIVPGIRKGDSLRAILRLAAAGYRLISRDQLNYTFLRRKQHQTQAHMTAGEEK